MMCRYVGVMNMNAYSFCSYMIFRMIVELRVISGGM